MADVTLPDGYGSIYCSTWFGEYANIQYSITQKPDCLFIEPVPAFITRVETDSGTIEAKECLANEIYNLKLMP